MTTPREHAHTVWGWACGEKDHCQGCDDTTKAVLSAVCDIRKAIAPALWELAAIRDRLSGALTRSELQLSINAINSATRAPRRQAKRRVGKGGNLMGSELGWVIVHPAGWVEIDYFRTQRFDDKGKRVSRAKWMEKYRPGCLMVKALLTWKTTDMRLPAPASSGAGK